MQTTLTPGPAHDVAAHYGSHRDGCSQTHQLQRRFPMPDFSMHGTGHERHTVTSDDDQGDSNEELGAVGADRKAFDL